MKQQSVAKNYIFNLGYQLLIVLVPLVVAPYISRVLGADSIGLASYAQSIVSCFALAAALGTAVYGQRTVAVVRDVPGRAAQVFWEVLALRVIGVGLALGLYFALVVSRSGHVLVYTLSAIELMAVATDISWFFQGMEDFRRITLCNGAVKLAVAAGIFLFVRQKSDLPIYVTLYTLQILLGNLSLWLFLPRYLEGRPGAKLRLAQHLRPTALLFLPQAAIYIYTVLDKTMLGLLAGSDFENGYYEQAQKLQKVLLALTTALGTVIIPRVANLWAQGKKREVEELLNHSFRLIFALSCPVIVGIWLVAGRFVPIFYGPGYEPVVPLLSVFVLILLFAGLSGVTGNQYMIPTGHEKLYTQSVFAGACINVCLNWLLIPKFAALGAAAASAAAECCITAIQMFQLRGQLSFAPLWGLFFRYSLNAAAMGCAVWLVGRLTGTGLFSLIAMVAVGGAVYGGLLLAERDPLLSPTVWKNITRAGQPGGEEL